MIRMINGVELEKTKEIVNSFMLKVYIWMTCGILLTWAIAVIAATSKVAVKALFGANIFLFTTAIILELAVVTYLIFNIKKIKPKTAAVLFFLYSSLNGLTIAPIFLMYTGKSLATAFFVTGLMFFSMSLCGSKTKRDLTGLGSFFFMGLIGIFFAMIFNLFLRNSFLDIVISIMAVIIFVGLTAYDTKKLREMALQEPTDDDYARANSHIIGALTLYLDFINIFIHLVRLIGKHK